ncbi:MAG TPA: methyltransferase domain-containing protein [Rhabdochlamydiaceae bacterium]|nr:methyltransferase domain-containing protein [Rhabdochlamydiaceae bacterium]
MRARKNKNDIGNRRIDKASLYWKQQDPTLAAMYKRASGGSLDLIEKPEVISYLPNLKGKKVLDMGAGIGRFTHHFASQAAHVTSTDMIPHFIAKNQQDHARFSNVDYLCSHAMDMTFDKFSFDFVFLNWLLMYLEDDQIIILIERIYDWLKPHGELFFRESCALKRIKNTRDGYYAHYRTLAEYDALIKGFTLVKEGHIQAYVHAFADPLQCYWHCKKHN